MRENLKPCPFCGGNAWERVTGGSIIISCHQCTASVRYLLVPPASWELVPPRARGAWNQRVTPEPVAWRWRRPLHMPSRGIMGDWHYQDEEPNKPATDVEMDALYAKEPDNIPADEVLISDMEGPRRGQGEREPKGSKRDVGPGPTPKAPKPESENEDQKPFEDPTP